MLVIKNKTKNLKLVSLLKHTFLPVCALFLLRKKVHVESLLSCVFVIWFHFELTHKKKFC